MKFDTNIYQKIKKFLSDKLDLIIQSKRFAAEISVTYGFTTEYMLSISRPACNLPFSLALLELLQLSLCRYYPQQK